MTEAAPNLRLVDTGTGEVQDSPYSDLRPGELVELLVRKDRDINLLGMTCGRLEKELANQQASEPGSDTVRDVLENWRTITASTRGGQARAGRLRAHIEPGGTRWALVKKWLKHKDPDELKLAFVGATLDGWRQGANDRKQRFDDVDHILGNEKKLEGLRDLALNEMYGRPVLVELPPELAADVKWLLETCDCGCPRMAHSRSDSDGRQGCLHHGCDCLDFDDLMTRAEGWKAERLSGRAA